MVIINVIIHTVGLEPTVCMYIHNQGIRRRLSCRKAPMKELEKIIQYKDVSPNTKAKIIHTTVFSVNNMNVKSGQ